MQSLKNDSLTLLALHNIFPYVFCIFQKILFLPNCITSIWKCFLQAFSAKYLSDTFSLGRTNPWNKGGCYQRQTRKQTAFCPSVIFYCCFVGTSKSLSSLQTPYPRMFCMATLLHALPLPSQWSLLLWLCYRLFQLCPSQLVCSTSATQQVHSGWCLSHEAALGTVWKPWICEFPFFNDWRRHLRAPSCFWEESELWIWTSASIINEALMGSAGFLKTFCWWRCWWETWHSEGQAVQPYGNVCWQPLAPGRGGLSNIWVMGTTWGIAKPPKLHSSVSECPGGEIKS